MSRKPLLRPESLSQGVSCFAGILWGVTLWGSSALHPLTLVPPQSRPARGSTRSIPQPPREIGSTGSLEACPALSEEQAIWIMITSPLAPAISCFKHLFFLTLLSAVARDVRATTE